MSVGGVISEPGRAATGAAAVTAAQVTEDLGGEVRARVSAIVDLMATFHPHDTHHVTAAVAGRGRVTLRSSEPAPGHSREIGARDALLLALLLDLDARRDGDAVALAAQLRRAAVEAFGPGGVA